MDINKNNYNPNDLSQFGFSLEETKYLDDLDGKEDGMHNGVSLFELATDANKTYSNNNNENFFDYFCSTLIGDNVDFKDRNLSNNNHTIDTKLMELFFDEKDNKLIVSNSKINETTIMNLFENDSYIASESIIQNLLDSNLDNVTIRTCLNTIKLSFDNLIQSLSGDTSNTSTLFDESVNQAISSKDASVLFQCINNYRNIVFQLEALKQRNNESTKPTKNIDYYHSTMEYQYILRTLSHNNLNDSDVFGNGYIDNPSSSNGIYNKSLAYLNSILSTNSGKQYINNLIYKSGNKISVYLPGAKNDGLPLPNGDGIFTYTSDDIISQYGHLPHGDGDTAVLLMAIHTYIAMTTSDPSQNLMSPESIRMAIFGQEFDDKSPIISLSKIQYRNNNPLETGIEDKLSAYVQNILNEFDNLPIVDPKLLNEIKFDNFKKLYDEQLGIITISVNIEPINYRGKNITPLVNVKGLDENNEYNKNVTLNQNDSYSILEVNDDHIIIKSLKTHEKLKVDVDNFIKHFDIQFQPYPENIHQRTLTLNIESESETTDNGNDITNNSQELIDSVITGIRECFYDTNQISELGYYIDKINSSNVLEIIKGYDNTEKSKRNSFIKTLLKSNISDDKKKEYLIKIKDAFVIRILNMTGSADYIAEIFDDALEKPLNSRRNVALFENFINDFEEITQQLEAMHKRNKDMLNDNWSSSKFQSNRAFNRILNYRSNQYNIDMTDFFGNGYLDNNAKQETGNCWAHGIINSMLATKAGKQYLNNLIVKNNDFISVYLPGAKERGLPQPAGDGIFTYSASEIVLYSNSESIGDGDYTAFMRAITDYRMLLYNNDNITSSGGNAYYFTDMIFGSDYTRNIYNYVDTTLAPTSDLSRIETNSRFKRFKYLSSQENGFFSIFMNNKNMNEITEWIKTNKKDETLTERIVTNHEYSLIEFGEDYVILGESNNPQEPIKIDKETFLRWFDIDYYMYPRNIMYKK